jgi:hypothetical protein
MDVYGPPELAANEHATRYALIDPILRALGWEVEDPRYVRVELCRGDRKKPDYACRNGDRTVMYVEAKKWGTIHSINKQDNPLSAKAFAQLREYCHSNSVKIGVLSDGGSWYVLDFTRRKVGKVIAYVDARTAGRPEQIKLLSISRETLSKRFP